MKLKYLGHSAFIIEADDFKGIIDPFISENDLCKVKVEELRNITHIFVTHGHGDHLGDAVQIAKEHDALVISNAEIGSFFSKQDIKVHTMHIGGKYKFDFGTVKLTPALHGSGINVGDAMISGGSPCGFLLEIDGKKIYHAGDTGLSFEMKLLEDENIDIAMIPIGGNYTMDIDDAVKSVDFIKPKKVIPMHYNTFDLIKADPQVFKDKVKNVEVKIMGYSEVISE